MRVTIERGETPILKNKSSLVYPIVSKFSVNMPNGDSEFVLQDENGIDLQMVKDGDEYLLQDNIAVGEGVFFGPDSQTATKPIRVLLEGPINLGHSPKRRGMYWVRWRPKCSIQGYIALSWWVRPIAQGAKLQISLFPLGVQLSPLGTSQ
jgi:hypothetical protein